MTDAPKTADRERGAKLQRFYIQWATVCWQVRDREVHEAVGWHKSGVAAKRDARARNAATTQPKASPHDR